ncbi:MAG TPA: hypothetical protein VG652_00835 [Gaiellaceae bacterium]|nr:hypothetical protein [Gaiellaceae bacterium]
MAAQPSVNPDPRGDGPQALYPSLISFIPRLVLLACLTLGEVFRVGSTVISVLFGLLFILVVCVATRKIDLDDRALTIVPLLPVRRRRRVLWTSLGPFSQTREVSYTILQAPLLDGIRAKHIVSFQSRTVLRIQAVYGAGWLTRPLTPDHLAQVLESYREGTDGRHSGESSPQSGGVEGSAGATLGRIETGGQPRRSRRRRIWIAAGLIPLILIAGAAVYVRFFAPPRLTIGSFPTVPILLHQSADVGGGWRMQVTSVTPRAIGLVTVVRPTPPGQQIYMVSLSATYNGTYTEPPHSLASRIFLLGRLHVWPSASVVNNCTAHLPAQSGSLDANYTPIAAGQSVAGHLCFAIPTSEGANPFLYVERPDCPVVESIPCRHAVWFALREHPHYVAPPTAQTTSTTPKPPTTQGHSRIGLGLKTSFGSGSKGWGLTRPWMVFSGGSPTGEVWNISWRQWGTANAIGHGATWNSTPTGGLYAQPGRAELRASNLGRCTPGGARTYRLLEIRVAQGPGTPWGKWHRFLGRADLCQSP